MIRARPQMARPAREHREPLYGRIFALVVALGLLWPAWSAIDTGLRYHSPVGVVLGLVLAAIAAGLAREGAK